MSYRRANFLASSVTSSVEWILLGWRFPLVLACLAIPLPSRTHPSILPSVLLPRVSASASASAFSCSFPRRARSGWEMVSGVSGCACKLHLDTEPRWVEYTARRMERGKLLARELLSPFPTRSSNSRETLVTGKLILFTVIFHLLPLFLSLSPPSLSSSVSFFLCWCRRLIPATIFLRSHRDNCIDARAIS